MGTSPLILALYAASAGGSTPLTMHHITSCTQCGRAWCASARRVPPQWTVFSWDDQHLRGSPVCGPSTPKGACVPCGALPCGAIPHTPTSHEGVLYAPTNASLPPPSPPCHPPPLPPPLPPPRPTPLLRPSWAPTYSMSRSTYTGYLDLNYSGLANSTVLAAASRYGLVTVSWNQDICHNARVSSPRSACAFAHADGSLRAQAARIRALNPTTRVLLYRNCALGMSTYGEQCRKMYDPAFARWWLRSHDSKTGPFLNSGIDPTKGDGDNGQRGSICPGPPAQRKQDQYLLDYRNASARQFLVDDLKGLVAGGADGIWLDDTHAFNEHKDEEAGYSAAAIAAIGSGLKSAAEQAMRELVAAGKWVYHFEDSGQMKVLESGDAGACTRALLSNNASGATANMFQVMQLPLFNASEVPAHGGQTVAHMFQQNLANFLMTRGAYSFMSVCGPGDCYIRPDGKGAGSMPPWFPEWDLDYGVPLGGMRRTTSGNFARNWSKCTVSLDCNQLKATFDWRRRPLPPPPPPPAPPPTPSPCTSDEGCQLNGRCARGSCECHAGWIGADCGKLDLIAGPPPHESGLLGNGSINGVLSSWGGSIVGPDDGQWHMFAAAMLGRCGIGAWGSNSEIVRAVSNSPLGPFDIAETVVPRFAHEPNVILAEDNHTLVMFYYAGSDPPPLVDCSPKPAWPWNSKVAQPNVSASRQPRPYPLRAPGPKLNYMRHAPGPLGPWSAPIVLEPGPVACPLWGGKRADLNFNAAIAADGSLVGLWRCVETLNTTKRGATVLHAVTARDWRNTSSYVYSLQPAFAARGYGSEDPFVWIAADHSYHAILHDEQGLPGLPLTRASAYGRHAWSRTGENWSISHWASGSLAYNSTVRFTGGGSHVFVRRERPHLVLGADRVPIALSNGASPNNDPLSMCFTLVQPIRRNGSSLR
eukprot:SAG11_NODE_328_length_10690_cov_25.464357_4_plen_928_part_00